MTDNDIKSEFEEAYNQAWSYWQSALIEMQKDHRCVMGDQWSTKDKKKLKAEGRDPLVFNKARRVCRLIEGYQRKHRLVLKVDAVEGSDDKTASQLTGCLMWVMQYGNAYNVLSDAFSGGALKTGWNLVHMYVDYSEDPLNGDIKFKRIPYNKFLLDPHFSERDFSDCTYAIQTQYKVNILCRCGNISKDEIHRCLLFYGICLIVHNY